jgi:sec-independent protein translocase protein TatC
VSRNASAVKRNPSKEMPLLGHLRELRFRLIVSIAAALAGAIVAFIFYEAIVAVLFRPFRLLNRSSGEELLFVNTIFEGFLIKLKVALISGVILSFPVHLYNIIGFVFPGLQRREKKVILVSLISSFVLIAVSFYYGYFKVIPISISFLTSSGFIPEDTGLLLNFGKNIFYIFQFILITILMFQLPIILEILMIMNIVKRKALLKSSKFVIVGIFVLAAVLTPPDFISQVSIALPLVLLFFLTILIAKIGRFGEG